MMLLDKLSLEKQSNPLKFHQKTWFIWVMLFLFAPIGIFLLWKNGRYSKKTNLLLSVAIGILFLIGIFPESNINIHEYLPQEGITKVYFTLSPESKVMFLEEEQVHPSPEKNKSNWITFLYSNNNGNIVPLSNKKGFYSLSSDRIVSVPTFGTFNIGEEEILLCSNTNKNISPYAQSRRYVSPKLCHIDVKGGSFDNCIEVITKTEGELSTKDYYAPHVGKVLTKAQVNLNSDAYVNMYELVEIRYN